MVWFNKNKKEEIKEPEEIPSLPQLPKLPDLPSGNIQFKPNILPRFPSNSLGNRFSENTIKDAISGEKDGEEETDESEEIQTMPRFPKGPLTRETPDEEFEEEPMPRREFMGGPRQKMEPMFVRLDKFEENLEIFEKIKKQLGGVEGLLENIKQIKEEESKELESWQAKLQTTKNQIDKIDRDIFSKIE